jgi:putative membrane protein insertion efficiency factor
LNRDAVKRPLIVLLVVLSLGLIWDLTREPKDQLTASLLLAGIDLYQATLSPRMAAGGVACRFEPTCSRYAEAVIRRQGAVQGAWRAAIRIARCGPWTPAGTVDQP